MSYDRNVYIGWFATLKPSQERVPTGATKVERYCPTSKKHKFGKATKFCPDCGAPVAEETVAVTKTISLGSHFFNESDPTELAYMTCGRATPEDMKRLGDSHCIFPEFMPYKPGELEVVFAPGYECMDDVARTGVLMPFGELPEKPSDEWVAVLRKVFGAEGPIELKFGAVMEVV